MTDGRPQSFLPPPVSRSVTLPLASVTGLGHVPAPATSNRACGSPAHGSPTPFTVGMRLFPPGLSRPGCDHGSCKADQPAPVWRQVSDHGPAEAAPAFVPLADEDRQAFACVVADLGEEDRGVAVAEVAAPAT